MALTNFDGAAVVITGGASGIGLATGQALRARGAPVVLADINSPGLLQAKEQMRQHSPEAPGQILAIPTDVTSESQVWPGFDRVLRGYAGAFVPLPVGDPGC